VKPGPSSERAVILAPKGRDASVAAALIREAGYHANICADLAALVPEIESGAGLALIADEAIMTADLRGLVNWLNSQPSWSDFPIVLLTHQGGGPERNPDAARLGQLLGNVTFLERPFHPTTLVSIVGSAVRGRRRQYQSRAILEHLTESEGLLQTADTLLLLLCAVGALTGAVLMVVLRQPMRVAIALITTMMLRRRRSAPGRRR